jgi:hypothetical protein
LIDPDGVECADKVLFVHLLDSLEIAAPAHG